MIKKRKPKEASPENSTGARYERKALREYLERRIEKLETDKPTPWWLGSELSALKRALKWVLGRQSRYDKRAGGL